MSIADSVMVSRYSAGQFAQLSLADGTLGRLVDIFAAFILGGLVLVPRAFGAGKLHACARIWRRSIAPAVGLGLLGALLGLTGAPLFLRLGQGPELAAAAGTLSTLLGLGYAAALLALGAAVFIEGVKRPAVVALAVVGANILNVALNWLLIGGNAGLPALGARGCVISTTIVRFVLAIVLVAYALRFDPKPVAGDMPADDPAETAVQRTLGLGAAAVAAIMLLLTASLLVFAGWLGPLALAVLAATFTLNAPVMLLALGIADATGIRVAARDGANASGQPDLPPHRFIVGTSLGVMLAILSVFVAAWCAVPRFLAGLFTHDPAMLAGLAALVPAASSLLIFDSICFIVVSALRALRDVAFPTIIEVATMVALVPLAAWLAFGLGQGVHGLIVAALASAVCRATLLVCRFGWLTQGARRTTLPLGAEAS
jgi:MATE family multidrug resistance protein